MIHLKNWFEKYANLLKLLFLVSVSVVIIREVLLIAKSTSLQQLQAVLGNLHPIAVLGMAIIGLLAIIPMLFYDLILTNLLPEKLKVSYVLQTSWITNTINNLCGFGGLISTGLRTQFYGKKNPTKAVLKALSKVIIFFMSGLSLYCLFSLILVINGTNPYLQKYWLWLAGGALYFPLVLIITRRSQLDFFDDLTVKVKSQLVGTSFLEWTGVLLAFVSVGKLMGLDFSFSQIVPLYVACSVIGLLSMIPGALGSFDVMMLLGLANLGIPHETAVIWILLFRLFYYLIPFVISLVLLSRGLGDKINQRYNGIPKEAVSKLAYYILVVSLYFSGILLVLSATIPEAFSDYPVIGKFNPTTFHFLTKTPSLVVGFLLLAMGRGVSEKVKRAFIPTLLLLIGTIFYVSWKEFSWFLLVILGLVLMLVLLSKQQFYREKLVYSWEMLTVDGIIYSLLGLLYVIIGVYNLPQKQHQLRHDFLIFPSERLWLSGLVTILITAGILLVFTRYLTKGKQRIGEELDVSLVETFLADFGGNETSHLIFLGDKELYIYRDKNGQPVVLFQYKLKVDKCMVMGEPIGDSACFPAAIESFMGVADRLGYRLVFYEVKESFVMLLHEQGFDFLKMGEEAYVDVQNFTISGKKLKGVRSLLNKMERENFQFELVEPPFSTEFIAELKTISDEWLAKQSEKSYSMGYFDETYLSRAPIAVLKDQNGKAVGFASIMPTYNHEQLTIDLMRHYRDAPSGIMDALFTHLFEVAKVEGYAYFNMGMAPLANVGQAKNSFFQERVAHYIYEYGTHFYSFQGLRNYKSKYASQWVAKYTAYPKNSSLIYTVIQLLRLVNAPQKTKKA